MMKFSQSWVTWGNGDIDLYSRAVLASRVIYLPQEHVCGDRHLLRGRADLPLVVDCGVADLQADGAAHQLLEAMLRGWGKNRPAEHIPASLTLARGKDHNAI
jgi:hypothetical protein